MSFIQNTLETIINLFMASINLKKPLKKPNSTGNKISTRA